jgi:hypothetical protein
LFLFLMGHITCIPLYLLAYPVPAKARKSNALQLQCPGYSS